MKPSKSRAHLAALSLGATFVSACSLFAPNDDELVGSPDSKGGAAPSGGTGLSGGAGMGGMSGMGVSGGTESGTAGAFGGAPTGGVAGAGNAANSGGGPSCATGAGTLCNAGDCCESTHVVSGGFEMGRSTNQGSDHEPLGDQDELPEHDAVVSDFRLDRFEVTVGRFRNFIDAYVGPPSDGAGAHPFLTGSGWKSEWDSALSADRTALAAGVDCRPDVASFTEEPGEHEDWPINCVTWYEAFAFCAWDGGRLPTEAEWEYAAACGDWNRLYPWGDTDPTEVGLVLGKIGAVGSAPAAAARWGQEDMGGSMWEWTLDWYSATFYAEDGYECEDCANLVASDERVARGGAHVGILSEMRAAARRAVAPSARDSAVGIRCARAHTLR